MSKIEFDNSEVNRLSVDLSKAPIRVQRRAPKVMETGAYKIKQEMKQDASGHRHLPELDQHLSYDALTPLDYEIGFDKKGQGNLANIAAFGSVNNPPVMDHTAGLRREIPHILRHLSDTAADSVLGNDKQ